MSARATVEMLKRGVTAEPAEWRRKAARAQWCLEMLEKWWEAVRHQDERCLKAVDEVSEKEFERMFAEEQAKVDAIRAEIDAVIEHDRWPAHLHFGRI